MTTARLLIVLTALLACNVQPVRAQDAPDPLAPLRARTEISDEDRAQIRTFISQQITEIIGTDQALARVATEALSGGYDGSDAYKRAYAAACTDLIGSAFKKAELVPASLLLSVLGGFQVADSRTVFIDALRDDRVGVRAAAAFALRRLQPPVAQAGGDAYAQVINALKTAGLREKSRDTLRGIYSALDFTKVPGRPDAKVAVTALLELLDARVKPYAAREEITAVGADDRGLTVARDLLPAMSGDERRRLTVITATMMRFALEEYMSPQKKLMELPEDASGEMLLYRNSMERLVLVGEELLTALLSPAQRPQVVEQMRRQDKPAMRLQWEQWNALLKAASDQDFTLLEQPEGEGEAPADKDKE